jgi:hypothetical protein
MNSFKKCICYTMPVLLLAIMSLYSCKNKNTPLNEAPNKYKLFSPTLVQSLLKNRFAIVDTIQYSDSIPAIIALPKHIQEAYKLNNYLPIWLNESVLTKASSILPIQLASLYDEGILLSDFPSSKLLQINDQISAAFKNQKNIPADSIITWDIFYTSAYLKAANLLLLGNKKQLSPTNDSVFNGPSYLVLRMANSSDFPTFDAFRPSHSLYALGVTQIKQGLALQKDSIYNALHQTYLNTKNKNDALQLLVYEINNSTQPITSELSIAFIEQYQKFHFLPITGELDKKTLIELEKTLTDQKKSIIENLERLRNVKQHIAKDDYVWTP